MQPNRGSMMKLILLNNIRFRLLEQLCLLEIKAESNACIGNKFDIFLQHKALVESEHELGLQKILDSLKNGPCKSAKNHAQFPSQSTYVCWDLLMKETYYASHYYNLLSLMYATKTTSKLRKMEYIYKTYYELISKAHDEILWIFRNLYGNIRECIIKQKNHSSSLNLDIVKLRNKCKYLIENSNIGMQKHVLRELSEAISNVDSGFALAMSKTVLAHASSHRERFKTRLQLGDVVNQSISEKSHGDITNIFLLHFELQKQLLKNKEKNLFKSLEVVNDILDIMDDSSSETKNTKDGFNNFTNIDNTPKRSARNLSNSSLTMVLKQIAFKTNLNASKEENKIKIKPGRPKLFGGSLEEYIQITEEQIPLIMKSCIQAISEYGLCSQGIFRVPGSQLEIMNFRDSFERGENPLAETSYNQDVNSIAGVLKLYLRELQEPLFPKKYFNFFIALKQLDSEHKIVTGLKNFFKTISPAVVIVIRYLFGFLNHLSEYAHENMMDALNLAISFGPTLMPTPEEKNQVLYQAELNELIKIMILKHRDVFPDDLGGPLYYKGNDNYDLRVTEC